MHAWARPAPIFGYGSGTDEEQEFAQDPGPTPPWSFADPGPRIPPGTPGPGSGTGGLVTLVSYALWPLLTLVIVALWFAATLDIVLYSGGEAFTKLKLLCMAVLVSAVATAGVASIGGVFGGQYFDTVARANSDEVGKQDPNRAYLFSFGLEHASSATPAESPTTEKQIRHN